MGIRYLTWLVSQNYIFKTERLSRCHLVIDGDNLMYTMLEILHHDIQSAVGTDFSAFAAHLERFFRDLIW